MRVLFVDDDLLFQQLFRTCLPEGHLIETVFLESLTSALEVANEFDICIFDLILPDSPSAEYTIEQVHKLVQKPSIILSVIIDYQLAYNLGKMKIGFVSKQTDPEGLAMMVSNIIGFYEPRIELYNKLQKI